MKTNKANRRLPVSICLIVLLGAMVHTSNAINYNAPGETTNYLDHAIEDFRLKVGVDEPDNTLIVTNGGIASVTEVYVGELSTSTGNLLSVTNGGMVIAGNVDTNNATTGGIYVGDTDEKGLLSVNHESEVDTDYLYVGFGTNESGTVEVEGDALLTIRDELLVGTDANSNNVVNVSDGGAVFVSEADDLVISNISGATNGFNEVNILSSGELLIGGDVDVTEITSTSNLNWNAGAVLGIGGEMSIEDSAIEDGLNVRLDGNLSTNTAHWDTGEMYIGDRTDNNSLTLVDGAQATATDLVYIGTKSDSSGNTLTVSGTNTTFTAQDKVLVGAAGDNNTFELVKGGSASIALDLKIGSSTGSDNNSVSVGSNSVLTVGNDVVVGADGRSNKFNIDHGIVSVSNNFTLGSASTGNRYDQIGGTNTVSGEFVIGETEDATGKTGHVDDDRVETTGSLAIVGEGATLDIQQGLTVGREGGGSILTIRDGGIVNVTGDTVIGEDVEDNYIYLQRDSNTQFNVTGDLIVGQGAGNNRFAVYGGTADIGGDFLLGATTNQHDSKNFIHLETTNAVLNVAGALHIGASNSVNTLDLVDGATATAQDLFVGAYEGVTNNAITVTGDDSLLSVSNALIIGSDSGSNNTVNIKNGGTLYARQDAITINAGTNNMLTIADGGTLKTADWDFAAMTGTATNIAFLGGSTLELDGTLSGTNQVEGGLGIVLNGTNSFWDTGTNSLYVGNETGNNSLVITNGAMASTTTNLYIGFTETGNTLTVGGTGSVLNVGADLFISNSETNSSEANSLYVLDGAAVSIGNDAFVSNGSTLQIDSKSQIAVAGDYEQDDSSTLSVGISSNATPPNLDVIGNAELAKNSTIEVYDDGIGDNTNVVQTIVRAGTLTIDGQAGSTGLLWDNINIQTNLLLGFNITVSNGVDNAFIVLDNFIKRSLADSAGLEGMLADVADEIQEMAVDGNEQAEEMIKTLSGFTADEANQTMEAYYGSQGSAIPTHNVVNQGIGGVASEIVVRGDNTRERQSVASAPNGAAGPHTQGQELQGWIAGYGNWGSRDSDGGFEGYDADMSGFIIGADLSVAQNVLIGLAGGANNGNVDKDNGGSGDTKTTFGAAYASLGTQAWFIDGSVIYGSSKIDQTIGDVFDTTASYDAQNLAFYVGGGKEIVGDYLIITPQASLLFNYYEQDEYTEESSDAVGRDVEDFSTLYIQSSIGCSLGFYTTMGDTTLKPEFRAHWLHEFNGSEEHIHYSLVGGGSQLYDLDLQAPEEDILKLGAGITAQMSEYLELRVDLDTQQGSSYSDYTLLGSLRYQF